MKLSAIRNAAKLTIYMPKYVHQTELPQKSTSDNLIYLGAAVMSLVGFGVSFFSIYQMRQISNAKRSS